MSNSLLLLILVHLVTQAYAWPFFSIPLAPARPLTPVANGCRQQANLGFTSLGSKLGIFPFNPYAGINIPLYGSGTNCGTTTTTTTPAPQPSATCPSGQSCRATLTAGQTICSSPQLCQSPLTAGQTICSLPQACQNPLTAGQSICSSPQACLTPPPVGSIPCSAPNQCGPACRPSPSQIARANSNCQAQNAGDPRFGQMALFTAGGLDVCCYPEDPNDLKCT